MSVHTIKNLMSKFSNKELNVLYFPAMSAIDIAILDMPINYFGNTGIQHKNLTNIFDLTWFSYDFIFAHFIDDTIINLSNTLHIPILYYVDNIEKIKKPVPRNTIFLYDTLNPISVENTICINIINVNKKISEKEKTKDCLIINYHSQKLNDNLKKSVVDNIPESTIIDVLPSDIESLENIFAEHKICIDFNSINIYDTILAIKNKCICINFYQNNNVCNYKYDNLYVVDNIDTDNYQKLIQLYNPNQFTKDIKTINSQINNNSLSDLASVYSLLKYRRYVV